MKTKAAQINLSATCTVCQRCRYKKPAGCSKNYEGLKRSNWCDSFKKPSRHSFDAPLSISIRTLTQRS